MLEVRNRRGIADQGVAFGARPFILCGLPIRRLPVGTLTYRRQKFRERINCWLKIVRLYWPERPAAIS